MTKKRYDIKTFAMAMAAIVAPLLFFTGAGDDVVRPPASDTNSPTLGVNTLRFNGSLIVTSTDKAGRRYGFQLGDIITKVEDQPVKTISDFIAAVEAKEMNNRICVLVKRDHEMVSIRRKFRGQVRGDNGERETDESIKQVGNYAQLTAKKKKPVERKHVVERKKKKRRRRRSPQPVARVQMPRDLD